MLVMPRRGDLGETRNDHQFGTARVFLEANRIAVAWNEHELPRMLDRLEQLEAPHRIPSHASFTLLNALRSFILDVKPASSNMEQPETAAPIPHAASQAETPSRRAA